jgi:hypothetical protein
LVEEVWGWGLSFSLAYGLSFLNCLDGWDPPECCTWCYVCLCYAKTGALPFTETIPSERPDRTLAPNWAREFSLTLLAYTGTTARPRCGPHQGAQRIRWVRDSHYETSVRLGKHVLCPFQIMFWFFWFIYFAIYLDIL